MRRELRVGIGGDIQHREIIDEERIGETAKGDGHEHELPLRGGARYAHESRMIARRTNERQDALHQCQGEGENECEMTEFRNHGWSVFPACALAFCASSSALAASGGM